MVRGGLAYALLASSGKKTVRQAGSHEKQPRETHQHPPRLYHVGIVLGTTGLFFSSSRYELLFRIQRSDGIAYDVTAKDLPRTGHIS